MKIKINATVEQLESLEYITFEEAKRLAGATVETVDPPSRYAEEDCYYVAPRPGYNSDKPFYIHKKWCEVVPEPKQRSLWINVYSSAVGGYSTRKKADREARSDRLACVEIKYNEGDGLPVKALPKFRVPNTEATLKVLLGYSVGDAEKYLGKTLQATDRDNSNPPALKAEGWWFPLSAIEVINE